MTTSTKTRSRGDEDPPALFEVRTVVILVASVVIGVTGGTLTWAAEAFNIWAAILAGFTSAGLAIPVLNKLVAH